MDTLVNPFKQASIGIAKGVSKIGGGLTIVSDSVVENAAKIFRTNVNNNNRTNINLSKDTQTFSIIEETQAEVIKKTYLHLLYKDEYLLYILEYKKYSTSCTSCYHG